uniref:Peptidase n=1 Tax=Thermosporothrix sp. COM3 TaxID=2490863 RepID=A0A455SHW5_9CHLR|nr:peptidase [Thermosporothrix sp. COM3]
MNEAWMPVSAPLLNHSDDPHTRRAALADLLMQERSPSAVALAPDGKRVAFVVTEPVPGAQTFSRRIWLTDLEGNARPLTTGKQNEREPCWSPDGRWLAFVATPEGQQKPQLYRINPDGGDPEQLCSMPNGVMNLAWAPDGSRISFLSLEGEEPKSDPKVLGPERYCRLWAVRPGHTVPEPITPPNVTVFEYVWSPDSKQVALYYSHGSDYTDWYNSEIGVVPANGGSVRQLTLLQWQARALAWSPDSTRIAYLSGRWSDPGRGCGDIFTVSVADGQTRNLTPGIDCSPAWCRWLPDGRSLLFTAVKHVTHQICLLDSQSGRVTVLDDDFVMYWDQPSLSTTPDGRMMATTHSTPQKPADVWYGTLTEQGIKWRQLSRLNPLLEALGEPVKTERIRYKSVDGRMIDGIFMHPLKPPADGMLPPLFVQVHGGPSGAECDSWKGGFSFMAATEGFAVFRPNYRGSWGQGAAFADEVLGDMGGKDFQDIMSGVEYLVQQGEVDGERVCIGGWSNGGFLSAWAITQTDRFKAAMVGAGIIDFHNMHGQSNIADADELLLNANPLDQPEVYRACSPLTFAGRVKTPTLILHGEADEAVPVAQAYMFYRALRERKVPVECVIYPREGHGFHEFDHMRDSVLRVVEWFLRYV